MDCEFTDILQRVKAATTCETLLVHGDGDWASICMASEHVTPISKPPANCLQASSEHSTE